MSRRTLSLRGSVRSALRERAVSVADAGDPDFASVVFLAGFNGANDATAYTEESDNAAVATFLNSAHLDTAQKKFGTSSLRTEVDTSDAVHFPDIAAYDLSNNDFTLEGWVCWQDIPHSSTQDFWVGQWNNDGTGGKAWTIGLWENSGDEKTRFFWSLNGADSVVNDLGAPKFAPANNIWYHWAACRDGTIVRVFWDGTQVGGNIDIGTDIIATSDEVLMFGGMFSTDFPLVLPFDGWIDETRFTVGVARYTANFTPPTEAFPRA
jgi:hypothetical protein